MSDKKGFMGLAALAAAGAGAAMLMKKTKEINEEETFHVKETTANYRNTERGKHDKNSKGIYYSNGNYEAFARPEKPEGVDDKHAYIVGSGLASLAAACFLVRDAQMPGDHIHILEAMDIAGGACDGIFDPSRGYIMRGGREMENHFECLWDLFRSIPSLEKPGASVLDEFYWLNKHDPNYSLCRATVNRGHVQTVVILLQTVLGRPQMIFPGKETRKLHEPDRIRSSNPVHLIPFFDFIPRHRSPPATAS